MSDCICTDTGYQINGIPVECIPCPVHASAAPDAVRDGRHLLNLEDHNAPIAPDAPHPTQSVD